MSKVIVFSNTYPAYHPLAGKPTYFAEQLQNSLSQWPQENNAELNEYYKHFLFNKLLLNEYGINISHSKHHTIRAGQRFKVGDYFSPRRWSTKPYASKQIILAPDVQILQIWNIEYTGTAFLINGNLALHATLIRLASNDGFAVYNEFLQNFLHWFTKPFTGQIICWNKDINY